MNQALGLNMGVSFCKDRLNQALGSSGLGL
jgi:hypothetical protein